MSLTSVSSSDDDIREVPDDIWNYKLIHSNQLTNTNVVRENKIYINIYMKITNVK
jgi:hypothetical protein